MTLLFVKALKETVVNNTELMTNILYGVAWLAVSSVVFVHLEEILKTAYEGT